MIVRDFDEVFSSGTSFPKVSVIIPLYNYAHMIGETLDALRHQDMRDFALIIVNDSSTDDSLEVARLWCEENAHLFTRIRLISNRENGGLSIARNTGISATTSEYLFFLDADNMIYPRCLGQLARALDRSAAAFSFSMLEVFAGRSGVIGTRIFDAGLMAEGNYIDAMAMIRRSALEAVDGYRPMQYGWEDYELWLRLIERGMTGIQVPELLGRYRSHGNSMSNTTTAGNSEAVKRQIRELHPWVVSRPAPEFLPTAAVSFWSRCVRYGGLLARVVKAKRFNGRELLRSGLQCARAYRSRGLRGVASELRDIEAATLRKKQHLDPKDVRWLPQFHPADRSCVAASLPLGLDLRRPPSVGIFLHIFDGKQVDGMRDAVLRLPLDCDLYISAGDDACKRQAVKAFSSWSRGKVEVRTAPFVQEGFEAAFTLFSSVLDAYDYLLLAHSGMPETGGPEYGHPLLGAGNVRSILAAFEADPSLGVVSLREGTREIREPQDDDIVTAIARAALRADPTSPIAAPADCMAWIRPTVLGAYVRGEFSSGHFRQNGRLGAALRKLLFLACENAGFNWLTVSPPSSPLQTAPVRSIADLARVIHASPAE
ncbi:MAG: glycosyltransferase [Agrobacterium sp.]|nr:glycosyltransferase [Agrobacterium sp.]